MERTMHHLTEEEFQRLMNTGLLAGSTVVGYNTEKSDIDIVVPRDHDVIYSVDRRLTLNDHFWDGDTGYEESDELGFPFRSAKVLTPDGNTIVNILTYETEMQGRAWRASVAASRASELLYPGSQATREQRVELYTQVRRRVYGPC